MRPKATSLYRIRGRALHSHVHLCLHGSTPCRWFALALSRSRPRPTLSPRRHDMAAISSQQPASLISRTEATEAAKRCGAGRKSVSRINDPKNDPVRATAIEIITLSGFYSDPVGIANLPCRIERIQSVGGWPVLSRTISSEFSTIRRGRRCGSAFSRMSISVSAAIRPSVSRGWRIVVRGGV